MIHIITPCTRPENLNIMRPTVPTACSWVIVLDATQANANISFDIPIHISDAANYNSAVTLYRSPYTGHAGNPNRNFALDQMTFDDLDWVYILDDDNIIHPSWFNRVIRLQDERLNMISWGQVWKNGSVRLPPSPNPRVGNIDTSCYMVRGRLMKHLRFDMDYCADGMLAERAASFGGHLCLDEYLGYYNYLRTPPDRE